MDVDQAAAMTRQDARAMLALGVDFVPVGRGRGASGVGASGVGASGVGALGAGPEKERLMAELRARYEAASPHREFGTPHTTIVWGEGDLDAELMFVGEAPGEEEDRQGRPFVGRAGELLDKMIVAMGLRRSGVYIANVLKVRPPNNATPTPEQAEVSAPYLYEQIGVVRPRVLVTLGNPSTKLMLRTTEGITKLRGVWAECEVPGVGAIPLMPTFHPAYVLRNYTEETRKQVWSDLKRVMERLRG